MSSILDAVSKDASRSGNMPAASGPSPAAPSGGPSRFRSAALVVVLGVALGAAAARWFGGEEPAPDDLLTEKVGQPAAVEPTEVAAAPREDAKPRGRREEKEHARAGDRRKDAAEAKPPAAPAPLVIPAPSPAAARPAVPGEDVASRAPAKPAPAAAAPNSEVPSAPTPDAPPVVAAPAAASPEPAAAPAAPAAVVASTPPVPTNPPAATAPAAPSVVASAPVVPPAGNAPAAPVAPSVVPAPPASAAASAPSVVAPLPGAPVVVASPAPVPPAVAAPAIVAGDAVPPNPAVRGAPADAEQVDPSSPPPTAGDAADGEVSAEAEPGGEVVLDSPPSGAPEVSILFVAWSRVPAERLVSMRVAQGTLSVVHEGEYVEGLQVSAIHPEAVDFKWTGQKYRVPVNPF